MQTFQTAAVVGLIDNMSGPLKQLSAQAKQLAQTIEAGKFDSSGLNKYTSEMSRANAQAREHLSLLTRIGRASKAIGTGVGVAGITYASRHLADEKNVQNVLSRLGSYVGLPADVVARLRDQSRKDGVAFAGGQHGFLKEAEAAAKSNVPRAAIGRAAMLGQQFGDYLGEGMPGEGFEKAQNVAEYLGYFKTKDGRKVNMAGLVQALQEQGKSEAEATAIAIDQMKSATGEYRRWANVLPGKESELFAFLKHAAPTAESLNISKQDMLANYMMLSTAGITGERAGTYFRGFETRGATPSFVAMAAARTMGMDPFKYSQFDKSVLDPGNFVKGFETQFRGAVPEKAKKALASAVSKFVASGSNDIFAAKDSFVDAIVKNADGKKDFMNSEMVNKRVMKQLSLGIRGSNTLDLLEDMVKQGKDTAGFVRAMYGIEAGTPIKQLTLQDIQRAREQSKAALTGSPQDYRTEWDAMMKSRVDSFYGTWEGMLNRFAAAFDTMTQSVEGPLGKLGTTINGLLDGFNTASDGVKTLGAGAMVAAAALSTIGTFKLASSVVGALSGGAGVAAAGAGGAAAGAGFGAGAAPIAGLLAGGALATAMTNSAIHAMSDEQRKALINNYFSPDTALGAAIVQGGPGATSDPFTENVTGPFVKHVGGTLKNLFSDIYRVVHGDYDELRQKYSSGKTPADWEQSRQDLNGPGKDKRVEVQGTVEGQATVKSEIVVTPSPWFETKISNIENQVMSLRGSLGGDKLGTNLAGSNGAKPVSTGGQQ